MASLFDKLRTLVKVSVSSKVDNVRDGAGSLTEAAIDKAKEQVRSAEKAAPSISTENMSDEVKQSAAEAQELTEKAKQYLERKEAAIEVAADSKKSAASDIMTPSEVAAARDKTAVAKAAKGTVAKERAALELETDVATTLESDSVEAARDKADDVRDSVAKAQEVIDRDSAELEILGDDPKSVAAEILRGDGADDDDVSAETNIDPDDPLSDIKNRLG